MNLLDPVHEASEISAWSASLLQVAINNKVFAQHPDVAKLLLSAVKPLGDQLQATLPHEHHFMASYTDLASGLLEAAAKMGPENAAQMSKAFVQAGAIDVFLRQLDADRLCELVLTTGCCCNRSRAR